MKHLKVQYNHTDKAALKRMHQQDTSPPSIPTSKHGQNSKDKEQHFPQTVNVKIFSLKRSRRLHISYFMQSGRGWWVLSFTDAEGKYLFPSLRQDSERFSAPLLTVSRDNDWKNTAVFPNPSPNCPYLTTLLGYFFALSFARLPLLHGQALGF